MSSPHPWTFLHTRVKKIWSSFWNSNTSQKKVYAIALTIKGEGPCLCFLTLWSPCLEPLDSPIFQLLVDIVNNIQLICYRTYINDLDNSLSLSSWFMSTFQICWINLSHSTHKSFCFSLNWYVNFRFGSLGAFQHSILYYCHKTE